MKFFFYLFLDNEIGSENVEVNGWREEVNAKKIELKVMRVIKKLE